MRSPDDESYAKLGFYAGLGIQEVWILDRDTKVPEIHVLQGEAYEQVAADGAGWIASAQTQLQLKSSPGHKLAIRLGGDERTKVVLPAE